MRKAIRAWWRANVVDDAENLWKQHDLDLGQLDEPDGPTPSPFVEMATDEPAYVRRNWWVRAWRWARRA